MWPICHLQSLKEAKTLKEAKNKNLEKESREREYKYRESLYMAHTVL